MKAVVITGATSGIGLAVCRELLLRGYLIIGVGRDTQRCREAEEGLKSAYLDSRLVFFCGDLMQQSEVLRIGNEIKAFLDCNCDGSLYGLINNAGCVRSYYATTEDGYEQQFALNHLAGFILTQSLMPCLIKGRGRVLMTSSASHKKMKVHWKDIMYKHGYNPLLAYKQAKLCNMLFALGLNQRFNGCGVRAYGIDPGLVKTDIGLKQTGGIVRLVWSLRRRSGVDASIPAKTYAFVLDEEKAPEGLYYYLCREARCSREVNKANADRLWKLSEQLSGLSFEVKNDTRYA